MLRKLDHAVVIGCGIAGMAQAAVLAKIFKKVTILEADKIDLTNPTVRPGVPQGSQLHVLLNRGADNFEKFLPGLKSQLVSAGANSFEYGKDTIIKMGESWWSNYPSGIKAFGMTRGFFEFQVRRRLLQTKNVELIDHTQVIDFVVSPDRGRIESVIISSEGQQKTFSADFFADCTGRYSRIYECLKRQGFGEPHVTEVVVDVAYVTQLVAFKRKPDTGVILLADNPPKRTRTGVLLRAENNMFVLGLGGYLDDQPPVDFEKMKDFLESLPSKELANLYADMEPIGDAQPYRFKSNLRRQYGHLELPDNFVFGGDRVCSVDPLYGQGMTAATMAAEVTHHCLKKWNKNTWFGFNKYYQKKLDRMLKQPWLQAVANDMRFPEVQGKRTLAIRWNMAYSRHLMRAMHIPSVHSRFVRLFHMVSGPLSAFHPILLLAALFSLLGLVKPADSCPRRIRWLKTGGWIVRQPIRPGTRPLTKLKDEPEEATP